MKKLIAAALTSAVLVASMAPAFAATPDKCFYRDASLCKTESLSPNTGD
jgi:hypothetical protein